MERIQITIFHWLFIATIFLSPGFSRDDVNVRNVDAVPISSTQTRVTWENSENNCDVIGYRIYYYSVTSETELSVTVYGGNETSVVVENLERYVIYEFSVAALQFNREMEKVGPIRSKSIEMHFMPC